MNPDSVSAQVPYIADGVSSSYYPMRVQAGVTAWQSQAGAVAAVSRSYVHENYYTDHQLMFINDLSVLFLEMPLPIGGNIQVLPLSPYGYPPEGSKAFVSGWGRTSCDFDQLSPYLKGVNVEVFSPDKCAQIMREMFHPQDSLCAGNPGRGTDESYKGDSGSPLVQNGYQIGIVSAGHCKGHNPHTVTVYTSIVYHRMWIKKVAGI